MEREGEISIIMAKLACKKVERERARESLSKCVGLSPLSEIKRLPRP